MASTARSGHGLLKVQICNSLLPRIELMPMDPLTEGGRSISVLETSLASAMSTFWQRNISQAALVDGRSCQAKATRIPATPLHSLVVINAEENRGVEIALTVHMMVGIL